MSGPLKRINPALCLEGFEIQGWTVGQLIPRHPSATGGFFSQSYRLTSKTGTHAYLKALDFYNAFGSGLGVIDRVSTLFNFECALLQECGQKGMDRVVRTLGSGVIEVYPNDPFGNVPCLIFEAATSDVRVHLVEFRENASIEWRLRSLHHVATGLKQLHGAGIAHQDLKPSNILLFPQKIDGEVISKVADLGRASKDKVFSPHDDLTWPGDLNYAPPEFQYSSVDPDWSRRRIGADLYMLGSLLSFIFQGTTAIASLIDALPRHFRPNEWQGSYAEVLPYVEHAFGTAVYEFKQQLSPQTADDLTPIYIQLCAPDPYKRGHPRAQMNKTALERFVSAFNRMARKAAAGRY